MAEFALDALRVAAWTIARSGIVYDVMLIIADWIIRRAPELPWHD